MKQFSMLLFVCTVFFSCKKQDTALFTIPVTNLSFNVNPTMDALNFHYIPINNVRFNAMELLDAQGVDTANINSIRPRTARVYLPFADNNLNFIQEIAVRICLPGETGIKCGMEAFWYEENIDSQQNKGSSWGLFGSAVDDLTKQVLADNVNLQIELGTWYPPNGSFEISLDLEFDVR